MVRIQQSNEVDTKQKGNNILVIKCRHCFKVQVTNDIISLFFYSFEKLSLTIKFSPKHNQKWIPKSLCNSEIPSLPRIHSGLFLPNATRQCEMNSQKDCSPDLEVLYH